MVGHLQPFLARLQLNHCFSISSRDAQYCIPVFGTVREFLREPTEKTMQVVLISASRSDFGYDRSPVGFDIEQHLSRFPSRLDWWLAISALVARDLETIDGKRVTLKNPKEQVDRA